MRHRGARRAPELDSSMSRGSRRHAVEHVEGGSRSRIALDDCLTRERRQDGGVARFENKRSRGIPVGSWTGSRDDIAGLCVREKSGSSRAVLAVGFERQRVRIPERRAASKPVHSAALAAVFAMLQQANTGFACDVGGGVAGAIVDHEHRSLVEYNSTFRSTSRRGPRLGRRESRPRCHAGRGLAPSFAAIEASFQAAQLATSGRCGPSRLRSVLRTLL